MENLTVFEALFRGIVKVTGIMAAQRLGFLKLRLRYSELNFFHMLNAKTGTDLEQSITVLKKHNTEQN